MKVAIVYTTLIHYRKSFFHLLDKNEDIDYHIIHGNDSPYDSMQNFEPFDSSIEVKNKIVKIKKHSFVYQFGLKDKIKKIKPDVVVLLGVDLHIVSNLIISIYLKLFTSTKIVWWGHGTFGNQGKFGLLIRNFFYNIGDHIFLYSKNEIQNFTKLNYNKEKIHVINNAINSKDYGFLTFQNIIEDKKKLKDIRKTFNILYIGRLIKEKKIELLLKAFSILSKSNNNYTLTIIGEGKNKQSLINLSKKYKINLKTKFTGALYGDELNSYLLNIDICIIPGYLGLSGIHVNSFGIPIITNDYLKMHSPEINFLKNNRNGSLFINESHNDLINHIKNWEKLLNQNFIHHVSEIINISKKYSPESMVNNFNIAIKNVLSS